MGCVAVTVRLIELDRPRSTSCNKFKLNDFHRAIIADVCAYIKSNVDGDLSLDAIARKAGYSRSHFSRMFRMAHGVTVQTYVTKTRMAVAAELLRDTNATVDTIMRRVGYSSSSGFVKIFMACYRRTPTLYRGQARTAAARAARQNHEVTT